MRTETESNFRNVVLNKSRTINNAQKVSHFTRVNVLVPSAKIFRSNFVIVLLKTNIWMGDTSLFGSTCICEQALSLMKLNKSWQQNLQTDGHLMSVPRTWHGTLDMNRAGSVATLLSFRGVITYTDSSFLIILIFIYLFITLIINF